MQEEKENQNQQSDADIELETFQQLYSMSDTNDDSKSSSNNQSMGNYDQFAKMSNMGGEEAGASSGISMEELAVLAL